VLLILMFWSLPVLVINRAQLCASLQTGLSASMGRRVTVGTAWMAPFPIGLHLRNVAIADDPAFANSPFFTVPDVKASVNLFEYMLSGTFQLTNLVLDSPAITLRRSPKGEWNVSSLGAGAASSPNIDFAGASVKLNSGRLYLDQSRLLEDVVVTMPSFGTQGDSAFTLAANANTGGTVRIDGSLGVIEPAHLLTTAVHANIALTRLALECTGWSALGGTLIMSGGLVSDGTTATLNGELRIQKLILAQSGVPTRDPLQFEFTLQHNIKMGAGQLTRGRVRFANSFANLSGGYSQEDGNRSWKLALEGSNLHAAEVADLLPAMGIKFPTGSALHQGLVAAHLSVDGPDDQLVTTGSVSLYNVQLSGFDLGKKLAEVSNRSDVKTGSEPEIRNVDATVRIARDVILVDQMKLFVPSIGQISGQGTFTPIDKVAFQLQADMAPEPVSFLVEGSSADPLFKPVRTNH
jgi:uncharacterized protein involved in outer membrane biogenesis